MARKCTFTGKRPNVANRVSHSNIKTKKRQLPNLQYRNLWWAEGERFVEILNRQNHWPKKIYRLMRFRKTYLHSAYYMKNKLRE